MCVPAWLSAFSRFRLPCLPTASGTCLYVPSRLLGSLLPNFHAHPSNKYEEKGVLLHVKPESLLQYTHWSHFDELPDAPENYRTWTFRLSEEDTHVLLSITEDNIPTEKKRERSDEFWSGVLATIKQLLET